MSAQGESTNLLSILHDHVDVVQLRPHGHIQDIDDVIVAEGFENWYFAKSGDGNAVTTVRVEDSDLFEGDDFIVFMVLRTVNYPVGYNGC